MTSGQSDAIAEVAAATERHSRAAGERDNAIRAAIAVGVPVPTLVTVTGLSRSRIYQIRDGKR
jgi:hypothetical protein